MTWREYHDATKHTVGSLRASQHGLDWANMPNPFRCYEGSPVIELPANPPAPEIPTLELLRGGSGHTSAADGPAFLSQLLFHSAAISATKRVPSTGYRYSLRVNPSSGNLHPTEFHFCTRGLQSWPDGLYHYRPQAHSAEQRATGNFNNGPAGGSAAITFVLTSIAWREAWKYRDRAYRYCLHDIGHAWQSLALAARAMGCDTIATGCFPDDDVARQCRIADDEWPMLITELYGGAIPSRHPDTGKSVWCEGQANRLSDQQVSYPLIDEMHAATKLIASECKNELRTGAAGIGSAQIEMTDPGLPVRRFGETARCRRSALDFVGGARSISLAQLRLFLAVALRPLSADFARTRVIQLYVYAHRVAGLEPGIYRYKPGSAVFEQIRPGDQRVAAAGLSLGQDLAGNACVAFSMIADLDGAACAHGDRGYRYAHFEAGAIGQRLYLAAEAMGLRATGIGAFFDDEVNRYLDLTADEGQVIYHFAIGYPIPDLRIEV
jgi:SagB-type dehydrogenase family enzyme